MTDYTLPDVAEDRRVGQRTVRRRWLAPTLTLGAVAVVVAGTVAAVRPGSASVRPPAVHASAAGMLGGCLELIRVGADALGVDRDAYARVLLATAVHDGLPLDAVVRNQLDAELASVAGDWWATGAVTALMQRVDTTMCG